MASLNTILKKHVREYLDGINVKYDKRAKLSELLEKVRNNNSSSPYSAVGALTIGAAKEFENQ
ncbi:hypothetical protein [Paenibacillus taichungensis]